VTTGRFLLELEKRKYSIILLLFHSASKASLIAVLIFYLTFDGTGLTFRGAAFKTQLAISRLTAPASCLPASTRLPNDFLKYFNYRLVFLTMLEFCKKYFFALKSKLKLLASFQDGFPFHVQPACKNLNIPNAMFPKIPRMPHTPLQQPPDKRTG